MLGTARLLTFAFRALVLLLLISVLWVSVAGPYNRALVSVADPLLPAGISARASGSHIIFENAGFASPVSIDGFTLHYGLVLMSVVVLAAVGIGIVPRLGWLAALGAGAFLAHVVGVVLLARGLAWASGTTSPAGSGQVVFSLFTVLWGLLPAAVAGVWCLTYWMPKVSRVSGGAPRGRDASDATVP